MNTLRCRDCVHFDEQHMNVITSDAKSKPRSVRRTLAYGWCALKSIYPAKEQDGQVFPPDVRRRDPDDKRRAAPVIVPRDGVVKECTTALRKP